MWYAEKFSKRENLLSAESVTIVDRSCSLILRVMDGMLQ